MQRVLARPTGRFERKREAILDAATALLNARGVRGLTLGEVAEAVGLSTTSITYYFKRKDELAGACMLRGIAALEAMAADALSAASPEARLHRLLALYLQRLRQIAEGAAAPLPSLADLRALNPPALQTVFQVYMSLFRRVRTLFDAPELDRLTRGRRTARTHLVMEQLFWAAAWLRNYDPEDYAAVGEAMFDILSRGVAAPGAVWAPLPLTVAEPTAHGRQEMSRDTFLLAATRLINARGYRGASVDKISASLNVTKGSFYHHNEAKDDLVVDCFARTFAIMRRVQDLASALPADPWVRLSSAAAALAEFQLSDQGPLLRASALSAVPEPIRRDMVEEANRVSERFAGMIAAGEAQGSMRPVDAFIAAQMLTATLNAAADLSFWVPDVRPKAAPAVFVRPLLMGLFAR